MVLRGNSQLIVKHVMPEHLRVILVGNNTVLNGVLESQDSSFVLCLVTHKAVFVAHTNHYTLDNKEKKQLLQNLQGI